jgi:predicted ArsR family transcriptional regulator
MSDRFAADVASIATLSEPVRRALYRYVIGQDGPVSREDAVAAVGVAHHVAKFNLDKLVTDGLLEVEYRRRPGRSGPGAGRPAKLYRRTARDIAVSLPERRYELAGEVLAEAITIATRDALPVSTALRTAARNVGTRMGEIAEPAGDPPQAVGRVLARHGYEPRRAADGIVLANCPFHRLAQTHTDLVCGMNLELVNGVLDRLSPGRLAARLNPGPGRCCVTIGGDVEAMGTMDR